MATVVGVSTPTTANAMNIVMPVANAVILAIFIVTQKYFVRSLAGLGK